MVTILYLDLLIEAEQEQVKVLERPLKTYRGRINGNNILIKSDLTENEKTCILAEELGHYYTSSGNILDQSNINNRKQEKVARKWAVNKLFNIDMLIEACKQGYETLYDMAEYFNVTEKFLLEAIEVFKQKYGSCYKSNNYTILLNDLGIACFENS